MEPETMNFRVLKRGEDKESNYALREAKLQLGAFGFTPYVLPDGDGYEVVGPNMNHPVIVTEEMRQRDEMRFRLGRKQITARRAVPKESIKVVGTGKPNHPDVVHAILEGKTGKALEIERIEARIRELLNVPSARALRALKEKLESRRPK